MMACVADKIVSAPFAIVEAVSGVDQALDLLYQFEF